MMIKWFSRLLPLVVAGMFVLVGCSKPAPVANPHTHDHESEVTLCGLCGEVKGTEKCCQEGVAACDKCMLHKDSPLCCSSAIRGQKDVLLCRKCGEVCFSKNCCPKEGAPQKCPECGLHKDSPGCCRLDPDVVNPPQENAAHDEKHHA